MTNPYTLKEVVPTFSEEEWKNYFLFKTKCAEKLGNPAPYPSWKKLKERALYILNKGSALYMVQHEGQVAGEFSFHLNIEYQPDKRFTYFRNSLVNKTLNEDILQLVFPAFLAYDSASRFMAIASNNGQNDFIEEQYQAKIGAQTESFELKISEAKIDEIEKWYEEGTRKFTNLKLKFYVDIPDDLMKEYCAVFTELLFDMPPNSELGDLTITVEQEKERQEMGRKSNRCAYRYLIFNEQDKLIAKTNVAINKNKSESMYQFMTGVLKPYRRQGLSKWLKAAMFKKLVADFPTLEEIETSTHPDNIASRELSRRMGYKKTGLEKEYLISRKQIEDVRFKMEIL